MEKTPKSISSDFDKIDQDFIMDLNRTPRGSEIYYFKNIKVFYYPFENALIILNQN